MSGKILFVSGIDTDIGKTIATGFYAKQLMQQGFKVITQKMIQTGCQGMSSDILLHRQIQGIELQPEDLQGITCPYLFDYPCSPHLAARLEKRNIDVSKIHAYSQQLAQDYDYVLLEGAGGLAVPYNEQQTSLDYVAQQRYPLILVTSGRLGSINHTLLSLMACKQHKIPVHSLIYNQFPQIDSLIELETQDFLENYLKQHFPLAEFMLMPEISLVDKNIGFN